MAFIPSLVRDTFEQGILSGASQPLASVAQIKHLSDDLAWASPLLNKWGRFIEEHLSRIQPDHVVVNDRRGAKIWSLTMSGRYKWGENLWHSTAIELMDPVDLKKLFAHRRVMLFDEMMQHGREMNRLRQILTDVDAKVTSIVCLRRRSRVESGDLLEYEAVACDDLDDKTFEERATDISRLVHSFEPPLDVDHLVVRGAINKNLSGADILTRLANWGLAYVVWYPDKEHRLLTITLDRPQFFETVNKDGHN
ncbi:unnamed protein product, partial [marine sediment metagenome]